MPTKKALFLYDEQEDYATVAHVELQKLQSSGLKGQKVQVGQVNFNANLLQRKYCAVCDATRLMHYCLPGIQDNLHRSNEQATASVHKFRQAGMTLL